MHSHLVTVKVGIKCGANQRVELDRLTFDQHRLERLNAKTVERGRAVEQHRMLTDYLFKDIPDFRTLFLNHTLGSLDRAGHAVQLKLGVDEGLEQLQRHLLGQAALMQLQFRTNNDDRTARVVNALTEQVGTEATLLALEHVGERLQRTLVGPGDDTATTTVVKQRIHRLLQHTLFVADDDVRRTQLHQTLEAVVTVNHAAVEIIKIGGRKTATIQRHQRAQFGRDNRNDIQHHPLGTGSAFAEAVNKLQTLDDLLALDLGGGLQQFLAQTLSLFLNINRREHDLECFRANASLEAVFAVLILRGDQLIFGQQLMLLERGQTRLEHYVLFEVQHALEVTQGDVEQQADAARQRLEEPDMRHRRGQLDMAHALAAHLAQGDFHTALFANNAAILHALVLAAQALIVLDRAEDAGAEQAVTLGLERAVVDGFRLLDLTERPAADALRGGERNTDLVKRRGTLRGAENRHQFLLAHDVLLNRKLRNERER